MEGLENPLKKSTPAEGVYEALGFPPEKEILKKFTPEQQEEIIKKKKILSSLAYFIGKDFKIPVELNTPGGGWYWNFVDNEIRIDPLDILEKPMDFLRFVISHEGGHRRITRADFIPKEVWEQPGFGFMMNSIEDPRMNNFVAESYPKFREQMREAYTHHLGIEPFAKERARKSLGMEPRFMAAGFEYIRQWFRESEGYDVDLSSDLAPEVREVVLKTLDDARDSWLRYPSREEADESEELIGEYAKFSYEINRDKVWPEFKKLIEADLEDQKIVEMLRNMLKEMLNNSDPNAEPNIPQELKDRLTPEEQEKLKEVMKKVADKVREIKEQIESEKSDETSEDSSSIPPTVNLEDIPDEIKQKLKEHIDSLPEEEKEKLTKEAKDALKNFEKELNDELGGKLVEKPEQRSEDSVDTPPPKKSPPFERPPKPEPEGLDEFKDKIEDKLRRNDNYYEKIRREVLPLIDKLEMDLREIFVARKARGWKTGFAAGKRIDIKKRIQEKAKSVSPMESRAWQKRELPKEKDYAFTLLVDLSGSMEGEKINETFKAVIVLTEVLNRLSINLEILGFNAEIHEFQQFGEQISKSIREKMISMVDEVNSSNARYNDDGWALETASERLGKQKVDQKFLVVLSDGQPAESPMHPKSRYPLPKIIDRIIKETDQHLVGLGIGRGTEHVSSYYPHSIADIRVREMSERLADLIKDTIANYDKF